MNNPLMTTYGRLNVAFESGTGAWLTDTGGERYLDALSGISVCGLGHANPVVTEAVASQAGRLLHTSNLYEIPLQEQLAAELCELSGLDRVFFANSGAEANEAAIKICRKYASENNIEQPVIIVMEGSFHGRTLATITATGNEKVKQGFGPLLEGFHHIPYGNIDALKALLNSELNIVAVMLEPIQGEGGIVIPPEGYLKSVANLCKDNNWFLVLDEIQTGMCRTGEWFACQHEGVIPDIMTLAKALGNGVPIGACLATEKAAEAMVPGTHGSTFGGNPLASSAGLAVIHYIKQYGLVERVKTLGERMLPKFKQNLADISGIKQIRSKGLMFGIELEQECTELVVKALEQHLLINVTAGNVVRLLPPLIINDEEADEIVEKVSKLIKQFLTKK